MNQSHAGFVKTWLQYCLPKAVTVIDKRKQFMSEYAFKAAQISPFHLDEILWFSFIKEF